MSFSTWINNLLRPNVGSEPAKEMKAEWDRVVVITQDGIQKKGLLSDYVRPFENGFVHIGTNIYFESDNPTQALISSLTVEHMQPVMGSINKAGELHIRL